MPLKKEQSDQMKNEWLVDLLHTCCEEPVCFCYGCLCQCCAAYGQRETLLEMTGEEYFCCGGMFPCGPLKKPCDKVPCLCLEAFCCCSCAVAGNRYIIQTRMGVRNSACDNCILTFVCLLSWSICLLEACGYDVPDEIEFCVDCLVQSVYSCMHAQQHHQIEHFKKEGWDGPPPEVVAMLPPQQQKMMQNGQKPPGASGASANTVGQPVGQQQMGGQGQQQK